MKRLFIFLFTVLKLKDYGRQQLSSLKYNFTFVHYQIIFGFLEANDKVFLTLNHLLLIFRYYVYVSRRSKVLSFEALLKSIMKVYKLEKILSQSDERKRKLFTEKWKTAPVNLWNFTIIWSVIPLKSFIIDTIAIFRTQSQLGWFLCYNNKHLTMFCWHGTLSLMFGSLH